MKYLGDFVAGATIYFTFNTKDASGAAITLAGTPSVTVRKNVATSAMTLDTAPTLAVDLGSTTGLHGVTIVLDDSDYVDGEYSVELAAGTVEGTAQAGTVLAHFSIGRALGYADMLLIKQATTGKVTSDPGANPPTSVSPDVVTIYAADGTTPLLVRNNYVDTGVFVIEPA